MTLGVRAQAAVKRQAAIYSHFQTHKRATIQECADAIGANYFTVRTDIYDLIKQGKLENTGISKDKAIVFGIPDPSFRVSSSAGIRVPLAEYHKAIAAVPDNSDPGVVFAGRVIGAAISSIGQQAYQLEAGAPLDSKRNNETIKALRQAKTYLQNQIQGIDDLLNNDLYWGPDVSQVLQDPLWRYDQQQFADTCAAMEGRS